MRWASRTTTRRPAAAYDPSDGVPSRQPHGPGDPLVVARACGPCRRRRDRVPGGCRPAARTWWVRRRGVRVSLGVAAATRGARERCAAVPGCARSAPPRSRRRRARWASRRRRTPPPAPHGRPGESAGRWGASPILPTASRPPTLAECQGRRRRACPGRLHSAHSAHSAHAVWPGRPQPPGRPPPRRPWLAGSRPKADRRCAVAPHRPERRARRPPARGCPIQVRRARRSGREDSPRRSGGWRRARPDRPPGRSPAAWARDEWGWGPEAGTAVRRLPGPCDRAGWDRAGWDRAGWDRAAWDRAGGPAAEPAAGRGRGRCRARRPQVRHRRDWRRSRGRRPASRRPRNRFR